MKQNFGFTNVSVLALQLMQDLEALAETAPPHELAYIAWRATQMTNDLCFAASAEGQAQRQRLAKGRFPLAA